MAFNTLLKEESPTGPCRGYQWAPPMPPPRTKEVTNIRKAEPAPGAMLEGETKTAGKSTTTESTMRNQEKEKTLEYGVP